MKSFDDFIDWTEATGRDDELAGATSELVAEAIQAGELSQLTEGQARAVYQLAMLVAGNMTLSLLESYHQWRHQAE